MKRSPMRILVTGGAGYIGSHACLVFLEAGHDVTVLDNLRNSRREALDRVQEITGKRLDFHRLDLLDAPALDRLFTTRGPFDAVVHFAGLKAVGESVSMPLAYYHNNLTGTLNLLRTLQKHAPRRLVFSSSATVYGEPETVPIRETFPRSATNPYGRTKLMIEQILEDLFASDPQWQIILLRYFNPVGAHPSGKIGEDPNGIPNNLMPYLSQVAVGKRPVLNVFGNDYPTPDGTGVRDYIHVMDLAEGHLKALESQDRPEIAAVNLGAGRGYSVLEVLQAFEKACGKKIPYRIRDRRTGDVPICYADPGLAAEKFRWQARRGIDEMCRDAWNWQRNNPDGYA